MKHQNPTLNVHKNPLVQFLTIAILSVVFAFITTACSTTSGQTKTEPSEPSNAGTNKLSPDFASTGSSSTSGDLSGIYSVSGTGAGGKAYQGEVIVTKRDAVYQMSWKLSAENYEGAAVHSGNTLAAAFTTGTNGRGCGAVIYKVNADNSLDGQWGEWGVNSVGTEKAVPVGKSSDSVGTFDVTGTNANGSPYKGRLTITKSGNDVYQFAWDTGTQFVGTGVKMGGFLAAGWGPRQCGFAIYEVKGSTLDGKWGVPGSTELGTEKAVRK